MWTVKAILNLQETLRTGIDRCYLIEMPVGDEVATAGPHCL